MKKNNKVKNAKKDNSNELTVENIKKMDMSDFDDLVITKGDRAPMPQPKPVAKQPAPAPKPNPNFNESAQNFNTAVLKPVPGGLQPIIAPKGQVQLNPVVVPVAFVPYSTQNQPLFQAEANKPQPKKEVQKQAPVFEEVKDQPKDKKTARAARKRDKAPEFAAIEEKPIVDVQKKSKAKNRAGGFIMFILNLCVFAFIALRGFATKINNDIVNLVVGSGDVDIISGWMNFSTADIISQIPLFLVTAFAVVALITLILSFVSLCSGKGFHLWVAYLLMFIIVIVTTLLGTLTGVFGTLDMTLNPAEANGYMWRLVINSAVLFIFGLIFVPRKKKEISSDDDFLADLD